MERNLDTTKLRDLIIGMRRAYADGGNAMAFARDMMGDQIHRNTILASLIAYDLQAGSYVRGSRANPEYRRVWSEQLGQLISPWLPSSGSLLEVGVGEATTLAGVLEFLGSQVGLALGFDISWSRISVAKAWLREKSQAAHLFVGDLFHIPLADDSVDVVYSSHSLEPNGGREKAAIQECLRVARNAVVLIEPIYELASHEAQKRMESHGYVRDLKRNAEEVGATVREYKLLPTTVNPLNPSGVVVLQKAPKREAHRNAAESSTDMSLNIAWQCPLTGVQLLPYADCFYAASVGLAYPVLREVPMLAPSHFVVASNLDQSSVE